MYIDWSQDDDEPNKPKAVIHPDAPFNGSLTDITNVQLAYGSSSITVIFFYESTVNLAMRDIIQRLGGEGSIHGTFTDSKTGVSWP